MSRKMMVICWKWEDLQKNDDLKNEVEVEGTQNLVIQINQSFSEEKKIAEAFATISDATAMEDQVFYFVHRSIASTLLKSIYQQLLKKRTTDQSSNRASTFKFFLFGGGKDVIYYQNKKDSTAFGEGIGLLNQEGRFMNSKSFKYFWKNKSNKRITRRGDAEVMVEKDGILRIRPKYFNELWQHYEGRISDHFYGQKLFELREDLLVHLMPIAYLNGASKKRRLDLFAAQPILRLRLLSLVDALDFGSREEERLRMEEERQNQSLSFEGFKAFGIEPSRAKTFETEYDVLSDYLLKLINEKHQANFGLNDLQQCRQSFEPLFQLLATNQN